MLSNGTKHGLGFFICFAYNRALIAIEEKWLQFARKQVLFIA